MGFNTEAIDAANAPDCSAPPIHMGATNQGEYTRDRNPTLELLERAVARLEGAEEGMVFSAGMAAISHVLLRLLRQGDRIVTHTCVYISTEWLLWEELTRFGVEVVGVDTCDLSALETALQKKTSVVYLETIANPNLDVPDIAAVARLAHAAGAKVVVDNTFASPYLCTPAGFGFDYVLHSATKYIGGHSDLIGGVVCCSEEQMEGLRSTVIETGGTLAPLEAWLCMRGLATLELRMVRHTATASSLASFLEKHPKVEAVHHPSRASHPQHAVAERLLPKGSGGMLAFEVAGGVEAGTRFCDAVELAWVAASLGGVHTLVGHAASTTHRQMDAEARRAAGIADGLIRVSVGLEDLDDIVRDFARALEKA
jgi:methionine-gamma-lyase